MGQKQHPYTKRLGITRPWIMNNYTWERKGMVIEENWVRRLVNGVNMAHNILTSEIIIKRIPGKMIISYMYYKGKGRVNIIPYIIRMMGRIIERRSTEKVQWKVIEEGTISKNAKIMGDYIGKEITMNPKQYKQVIGNIMKIY